MRLFLTFVLHIIVSSSTRNTARRGARSDIKHIFDRFRTKPTPEGVVGPVDFPHINEGISVVPGVSCTIVSVLGTGTDSQVFEAKCGPKGEVVAIKYQYIESSDVSESLLIKDWFFLSLMKGVEGIPKAYYLSPVGRYKRYPFQFLIMEKVGVPLRSYRAKHDILPLLRQVLTLLKKLHAKGFYFGDVHLENIMVKDTKAYLVDFGRAGPYMYKNGTLIEDQKRELKASKNFLYLSPAELNNRRLSRRDDFFRLAECAVRLSSDSYKQTILKSSKSAKLLARAKLFTPIEELLANVDPRLQSFYEYTRSLKYYDIPRYDVL